MTFYILIISLCIVEEGCNSKETFLLLNEKDLSEIGFTIGQRRLILNKTAEINNNRGNYYNQIIIIIRFFQFKI